jgi:hypothetical protein
MTNLEKRLELDDSPVVTKTGRVFRLYYKKLLDSMPQDLVAEMAYREIRKIEAEEKTSVSGPVD